MREEIKSTNHNNSSLNDPKGLGWDRNLDPLLYDLYARKLPQRGWPGQKSPEEKDYIRRYKARQRNGHAN